MPTISNLKVRLHSALKPCLVHLLISVFIALIAALLIFKIWYPWPLDEMVSGRGLFWLVVGVDVICGPLLTLIIWNKSKPRSELLMDLSLIAFIQLAALAYGLHTVAQARPVYFVFETDRLRIVTASEIDPADLAKAPEAYKNLPWSGPGLLGLRHARDGDEFLESVDLSIAGKEPSVRPNWWQPYENSKSDILARARPLADLSKAKENQKNLLSKAIRASGVSESNLVWLPLTSARSMEWIVLLDKQTALPKGYVPIDGFF